MSQLSLSKLSTKPDALARTKHEQLRDHLVEQIKKGQIKPGSLLPSEQTIAESLGVARNTVRQAMASLEQDGFIQRIHGKGTFVHEHIQEKFRPATSGLYAVIVPETQRGFYPSLLSSFTSAAEAINHQVIIADSRNQVDRQGNAILQLLDREVSGVAIVPTTSPPTPEYQIRQLQKNGIPVVFCSRRVEGARAPLIAIPFEQLGLLAGNAMLDAGHREIALFFTHNSDATRGYEAGIRKAFGRWSGPRPIQIRTLSNEVVSPEVSDHDCEIDRLLKEHVFETDTPVTAIFSGFDSFTEHLYLKLIRAGYRVPEDISLVGFGASQRTTPLMKQLTAVTIDEVAMGQRALEYLDKMRRNEIPLQCDEVTYASVALHRGESLAPPRSDLTR